MTQAVLFDFGGVILTSPFDAFAAYEKANGLPPDLIRTINSTDPDDNAWAQFERGDLTPAGFGELFSEEAAALGHEIDGLVVLSLIEGTIRPQMVEAVRKISAAGFKVACLTNNFRSWKSAPQDVQDVMNLFDEVVESSVIGVRKPEPLFYETALELLDIEASEAVFLDDLGINLKPARAMGMTTIKVGDPNLALAELATILDLELA